MPDRRLLGIAIGVVVVVALIAGILTYAVVQKPTGLASSVPATATVAPAATVAPTAASNPTQAGSPVATVASSSKIPSAPLVASLPSSAEQQASAAACAPFLKAGQRPSGKKQWSAPPKQVIDKSKTYRVKIYTTSGTITADVTPSIAPITANSFIFLSCNHFYDGIIFHRVIPKFMVQGGDPTGTGGGGPGYQFVSEPVKQAYRIGSLAMANAGANTNGSQFFIVQGPEGTALQPNYNLFGQVVRGENVVDAIATTPTKPASSANTEGSSPVHPPVIKTITVSVG